MPVDEAVLDYDPLGEFEQDGRKMLRLLLVAAQRVMVDQIVSAALKAKLEPVGLDLVPFAHGPRRRDLRRGHGPRGDRRRGRDRHRRPRHEYRRPRARHDPVRADPPLGRPRHHDRDRTGSRHRGRPRRAAEARRDRRHRGRPTGRGGPRARDAACQELRGRDPVLARVLYGPGPGSSDRPRARLGWGIQARGVPGPPAPADPGGGRAGPASSSTCGRSSRSRRTPSPKPSRSSRWPSGSRSRGGRTCEPGQPPSPGYPRAAAAAPPHRHDRAPRWRGRARGPHLLLPADHPAGVRRRRHRRPGGDERRDPPRRSPVSRSSPRCRRPPRPRRTCSPRRSPGRSRSPVCSWTCRA